MIKIKKIISGLIRSDLSVEHIYDMIESDIETKPPKLVTESGVLTKVCIVCSLFSFFHTTDVWLNSTDAQNLLNS
jgi:hypothetical protein